MIVVGTNSWITLVAANTYFSTRWGASGWTSLTDNEKESLLITAFNKIFYSPDYSVSASSTAQKLKNAQCELAWYLYNHYIEDDKRAALRKSGVQSFRIDDFSETLTKDWNEFPPEVEVLLDDYKSNLPFAVIERDID